MSRRAWWSLAIAVAVLALAASANSVANGYAYDDVGLLVQSPRIHSLDGWFAEFSRTYWPGADGYRPFTIIAWRVQWALGAGSPMVFHAVNVALHVATSVAAFWLAGAMLPVGAAWVAAALYAVHPVHVEAIANVVGQSDLFVALLLVLATGLYVRGRQAGRVPPARWLAIAALYAAACLFKEHGIMLPALLVLAEATVVPGPEPLRARLARVRVPLASLVVVALVYLWARSAVVVGGASGFQPFVVFQALDLSATDRVLTMIGASPEWLRLFLWPARLMTQYAPQYVEVAQGPSASQLPGLLVLAGTLGLGVVCWRRSPVTAFGIWWLVITLLPASNFLVAAGFIIAERTLLLPSLGAMIALASSLPWLERRFAAAPPPRFRVVTGAAVALLLGLGVARSVSRNPVWRDNETLFQQGVIDSPTSYRAHFQLAAHLFSTGRYAAGEGEYRRAIELFPHDPVMVWAFAEQLRTSGKCEGAIMLYRYLFSAMPDARRGHFGYAACLVQNGEYDEARDELLLWLRRGGRPKLAHDLLLAARAGRDSLDAR